MNKKILIIIPLIFLLVAIILNLNCFNNKEKIQNKNTVEQMKKEIGATASEEIYQIHQEYDGREILTIKPDIQYQTVLAGILKNARPTLEDIEQLDLSSFKKGIWISDRSRDKFLQILTKCDIKNFDIDKEGYLYIKENSSNENSLKLEKLLNTNELIVIDITGSCYIRDDMTGEIVEYPFKDMDLYQVCEIFGTEGSTIFVITTNNVKEIEILNSICN